MSGAEHTAWWQAREIKPGQSGHWQIGPLSVHARNAGTEWRFAWQFGDDPWQEALDFEIDDEPLPDTGALRRRFAMGNTGSRLQLQPRLADRAVMVMPETDMSLPADEHCLLYIASPLWLAISAGPGLDRELMELPVTRLSDTWFGPNTREGTLCYSLRTRARTRADRIEPVAHRAITPLTIHNRSKQPLELTQLRVPMNALGLYQHRDKTLWSDAVTLTHEGDSNMAAVHVRHGAGREGARGELIAGPRETLERNTVIRAFSQLFS